MGHRGSENKSFAICIFNSAVCAAAAVIHHFLFPKAADGVHGQNFSFQSYQIAEFWLF